MSRILYAYFDLDANPLNFGIGQFCGLMAAHKRRYGFDAIDLTLVPPTGGPEAADPMAGMTPAMRAAMARNVLYPLVCMVPDVIAFRVLPDRQTLPALFSRHDRGDAYPKYTRPDRPTQGWSPPLFLLARLLGERMDNLVVPAEAQKQVDAWLGALDPTRPLVTMTLREQAYKGGDRNVDRTAWIETAHRLQAEGLQPVMVRDTDHAFAEDSAFAGLITCPEAAVDTWFRTALYDRAAVNVFVPNGPALLCHLVGAPSLFVKMVAQGFAYQSATFIKVRFGMPEGAQNPANLENSVIVWERDTVDTLYKAIRRFVDENQGARRTMRPLGSGEQQDAFLGAILSDTVPRVKASDFILGEDVQALSRIAELGAPEMAADALAALQRFGLPGAASPH